MITIHELVVNDILHIVGTCREYRNWGEAMRDTSSFATTNVRNRTWNAQEKTKLYPLPVVCLVVCYFSTSSSDRSSSTLSICFTQIITYSGLQVIDWLDDMHIPLLKGLAWKFQYTIVILFFFLLLIITLCEKQVILTYDYLTDSSVRIHLK